jgi:hypothetical protein
MIPEARAQVVVEARVEVDGLVGRAVERADGARRLATGGADRLLEDDRARLAVLHAELERGVDPERVERHHGSRYAAVDARVGVSARIAFGELGVVCESHAVNLRPFTSGAEGVAFCDLA